MAIALLIKDIALPIIMAIFLAYIAYQQMVTNRNKLRLDLYNKRFEVYSVALEFYQELIGDGASTELKRKFIEKKEAANFLFSEDPTIYLLLNEMHNKSFKISAVKDNRKDLESSHEVASLLAQESLDAANWFGPAIKSLSSKMECFLKFNTV
jgi:hypothetical protein